MELFLKILILSFVALGITLIIVQYYPVLKRRILSAKYTQQIGGISKSLDVLSDASNSQEAKAAAFVALMAVGYVLIHLMGNQGKNYNDKKQMRRFQKHWSSQQLDKLNALDGGSYEF
ncbi:MAG: hypothetical protein FWD26_04530 [Treponema sp.]|nr:hypothetical protein [Treponema sp.]